MDVSTVKSRAIRLALIFAAMLLAGLLYMNIVMTFGVGMSCPFERITGLLCPGCGISGMFLALAEGDVAKAFACNPVTFCLLPVLSALIIYLAWRYVLHGDMKMPGWMNKGVIALVCIYVIWGVVRNLI